MHTPRRRLAAAMGVGVALIGALALPASPASAAANVWTCDNLTVFEPPVDPYYTSIGTGNCTGGDPAQRLGYIVTRNPSPAEPVRAYCPLNAQSAPQVVSGRPCSVSYS
ncbi:hypothetical protein WEI85_16625 [Actinomycetes bacterium KLBMP 9797]